MAIAAFRACDCAGLARVDFLMEPARKGTKARIYLNEINTMPGFTSISMYPKLWEASGLPYKQLIDRLITLASERHKEKLETSFSRINLSLRCGKNKLLMRLRHLRLVACHLACETKCLKLERGCACSPRRQRASSSDTCSRPRVSIVMSIDGIAKIHAVVGAVVQRIHDVGAMARRSAASARPAPPACPADESAAGSCGHPAPGRAR